MRAIKLHYILSAVATLALTTGCASQSKRKASLIVPSVLGTSYGVFIYEHYLTPSPFSTNSQQALSLAREGWKPAETISAQGWSIRFERDTVIPGARLTAPEMDALSTEDDVVAYFHNHSVAGR